MESNSDNFLAEKVQRIYDEFIQTHFNENNIEIDGESIQKEVTKKVLEEIKVERKILQLMLPQLIVNNNLYDLYLSDSNAAIEEVLKILDEGDPLDKQYAIIIKGSFEKEVENFSEYLSSIDENIFKDFSVMFLSYAVRIYETMVNEYLQDEITLNFDITIKEANEIISKKLNADDKVGWFLKILTGKNFIDNEKWGIIKNFINTRNYFIHYKPDCRLKLKKFEEYLNKKSIFEFLDAARSCYTYFNSESSQKLKQYYQQMEDVRQKMTFTK